METPEWKGKLPGHGFHGSLLDWSLRFSEMMVLYSVGGPDNILGIMA